MSDNYDGPAMAQQIMRLQARVKELDMRLHLARLNSGNLAAENANLSDRIKELEAEKEIWGNEFSEIYNIKNETVLLAERVKDAEEERAEWVRRCESVEVQFNDLTIENTLLAKDRENWKTLANRDFPTELKEKNLALAKENARLRKVVDAVREHCRVLAYKAPVPLTEALRELDAPPKGVTSPPEGVDGEEIKECSACGRNVKTPCHWCT